MTALRAVTPPWLCDAASLSSYASVSTIVPPTPSTNRLAPISSRATASDDAEKSIRIGEGYGARAPAVRRRRGRRR